MLENATRICEAKFRRSDTCLSGNVPAWSAMQNVRQLMPNSEDRVDGFQPTRGGFLERVMRPKKWATSPIPPRRVPI